MTESIDLQSSMETPWQNTSRRDMDLNQTWQHVPSLKIFDYCGPYPVAELENARTVLIVELGARDREDLERMKPKLGLKGDPNTGNSYDENDTYDEEEHGIFTSYDRGNSYPSSHVHNSYFRDVVENTQKETNCQKHKYWNQSNTAIEGVADIRSQTISKINGQSKTGKRVVEKDLCITLTKKGRFSHTIKQETAASQTKPDLVLPTADPNLHFTSYKPKKFTSLQTGKVTGYENVKRKVSAKRPAEADVCIIRVETRIARKSGKQNVSKQDADLENQKKNYAHITKPPSAYKKVVRSGLLLKCDLCDFCVSSVNETDVMNAHLKETRHTYASVYETVKQANSSSSKIGSILQMKHCKNELKFINMSKFVLCPICWQIFPNIFSCGVHYKYLHRKGKGSGFYVLKKPTSHEKIVINKKGGPTCQKCQQKFPNVLQLSLHWKAHPEHWPLMKVPDLEREVVIFSCPSCTTITYNDFLCYHRHVRQCQPKKTHCSKLCMDVKYFDKSLDDSTVRELPPFKGNCMKTEQCMLKIILNSLEQVLGLKKIRVIKKKLKMAIAGGK